MGEAVDEAQDPSSSNHNPSGTRIGSRPKGAGGQGRSKQYLHKTPVNKRLLPVPRLVRLGAPQLDQDQFQRVGHVGHLFLRHLLLVGVIAEADKGVVAGLQESTLDVVHASDATLTPARHLTLLLGRFKRKSRGG